jgi:nicotinamidase-related amidase
LAYFKDANVTILDGLRAAMAEVDAFYKQRGIFQAKFGFGKRPALVVIDMAYGWTDPAYAGGSALLEGPVQAIAELLPVARARHVPVIYTTSPYQETPQIKSAADFSPAFRAWDRRACVIDERLAPLPGEYVVVKEHASAFAGTALVGHLLEQQIDTLLITGCSTSACVRATATDAKVYHLRPIIIREAVGDRSEIAHEWTLFDVQARFADVAGLVEVKRYLTGLPDRLQKPGA